MHVVCTAGHVDHGKSTLVKALTGMEPDRFAEEQERGLTIDLGFAWTALPGAGRTVAFVDLPGHERFVGNMLAGAGPVELALFVVAADEGWMPQSQEHLDILDLLGVRRGLVALTKADLVDADDIEVATALVHEELAGSTFAGAEVVPVSAVTGANLDVLVARLDAVLEAAPEPADRGRPRLWVDRSFSVRGAGTVVTGTLAGGRLQVGDELDVLPGGERGRIRGLQALKSVVGEAPPGSRVAVNLSGLERTEVVRGDAVGLAGQWLAVSELDARIRALPGHELGKRGSWHLHVGSGRRQARIFPLHHEPVGVDGGFARVVLDHPVAVCAGDRFVIRDAGRQSTAGGGVVLDADPPRRPRGAGRDERDGQLAARRAALDTGDRAQLLALHVAERGAADLRRAAAVVGLDRDAATEAARGARLLPLGTSVVHPRAAAGWTGAVTEALRSYHAHHPVDRAAPKDVAVRAATAAGCPEPLAGALLDALVRLGRVAAEGPGLRSPDHSVRLDPVQTAARDALLGALGAEPFAPPNLSAAAAAAGASVALVRELEAAGQLVRLGPDLALVTGALDDAVERLRAAYAAEGPLTAARAKEVLGTSRKYALPLLEELDRRGRTRREGDVRHVR
jgi:selenocysteine-specific elongation factor